jgi:hypothetical protein
MVSRGVSRLAPSQSYTIDKTQVRVSSRPRPPGGPAPKLIPLLFRNEKKTTISRRIAMACMGQDKERCQKKVKGI